MSATDAHALEEFCSRWSKPLFAFGRMFLGDGTAAEELTCDVLLAFYRQRGSRLSDRELLPRTLGLALLATHKYRPGSSRPLANASRLETAIQGLPRLERAVVIMRDLLHMDWESMALASDLSQVQAHEVWVRGYLSTQRTAAKRSVLRRVSDAFEFGLVAVCCFVSLVSFPHSLYAQQSSPSAATPTRLSLEMATEILMARNPTLLRERQNIAAARGALVDAKKIPNPEFRIVLRELSAVSKQSRSVYQQFRNNSGSQPND